ncbi:MAG: RNA pseudouridine synthase [Tenericutes bacterium GWC2_34_14]|nr:MAG: RNA pseudouridine synthase [Tenericutes bacterium GWA2_35_7]OHE29654.1 MAG: RNA pseudouridine synthase [Tenericutes bacterium GWC2_34_14]OHE34234.1 MAG: RNA pseudouridine synthase [Tenericutes bacterium GWE2_34_108]OHE35565.1 MAG: RNA pseudouridine synthase [Tenericutes bacterium GWF1_35_14]OHE38516.1 MAG: RNA pseudouridine synthase [Tenericutes bacterium GWF2_35_184]OHE43694.1 MAG: RNA pseudouridine synthase [Tenericutes bacterium RIFOXYA2_FULL_36_32]OHE45713.1 MAG: RNA pseudouridine
MKKQYKVDQEHAQKRLDQVVQMLFFEEQSRSFVQKLIKDGICKVNNEVVKTGYTLKLGDIIEVEERQEKKLDLEAVDLKLDIVYEDDDLLVINKPQGLVVHPASSYHEPTLVHGLLHQVDELSTINGVVRPGIVHRIDKDTSGLLVVAKTDVSHQFLSSELQDHLINRIYIALVYGDFKETEGTINAPIARHPKNRLKMDVIATGKSARTKFKVLERFGEFTLLQCELETGRTHQIRVHMAFIHHPVVGDPIYGPKEVIGKDGQFLHAKTLSFMHPTKKEQMTFHADLPQNFLDFLEELRKNSVS